MHSEWVPKKNLEGEDPSLSRLSREFGPLIGKLLWARDLHDPDELKSFLNPKLENLHSPFSIKNLRESCTRLLKAIENREAICIYADYDMDGMSGLALIYSFLEACGAQNISHYQPHRFEEGYGLHPGAIETLAKQGTQVVVTVDTGITAFEAAQKAKSLNIDLIITDHHQQVGGLPETPWLINPNQQSDESGLGYLSGAGVAFYVCMGLRSLMRENSYFSRHNVKEPDLRQWLDVFTLGTVGDVVDLKGDNRILVSVGLQYLQRTQRPGLKHLLNCTLMQPNAPLTTRDISFSVIPKLNAASRMGQAHLATELLLCKDMDRAWTLVDQIIELNQQRSEIQEEIYQQALLQAESQKDSPFILTKGPWHEGVLGIVAAKLSEKFSRPAVVLSEIKDAISSDNFLRGSMRAPDPFHCVQILEKAKDHLIRFGGHQAAAGMHLPASAWDHFKSSLLSAFESLLDRPSSRVYFDAELNEKLPLDEVLRLAKLGPWGAGNPEPLFLIRNVHISAFQTLKKNHIKAVTDNSQELIGFYLQKQLDELRSLGAQQIDLLGTPEINFFQQTPRVQMRISKIRQAQKI